jgi:hypothetical protein
VNKKLRVGQPQAAELIGRGRGSDIVLSSDLVDANLPAGADQNTLLAELCMLPDRLNELVGLPAEVLFTVAGELRVFASDIAHLASCAAALSDAEAPRAPEWRLPADFEPDPEAMAAFDRLVSEPPPPNLEVLKGAIRLLIANKGVEAARPVLETLAELYVRWGADPKAVEWAIAGELHGRVRT